MLRSRRNSMLDRAQEYVEHLADTVTETVIPQIEQAWEQAVEKAGPVLAEAREMAAPVIADAREKAAPVLAEARDRALPLLEEGRASAGAKVDSLGGVEPEPSGGRWKKFLLFGGLLAIAGAVFAKLRSGGAEANWQSTYVPPAPPSAPKHAAPPAAAPAAPAAAGDNVGEESVVEDLPAAPVTDDIAGAGPGEALSDAAEAPHEPTTPDEPADIIDVDDVPPARD